MSIWQGCLRDVSTSVLTPGWAHNLYAGTAINEWLIHTSTRTSRSIKVWIIIVKIKVEFMRLHFNRGCRFYTPVFRLAWSYCILVHLFKIVIHIIRFELARVPSWGFSYFNLHRWLLLRFHSVLLNALAYLLLPVKNLIDDRRRIFLWFWSDYSHNVVLLSILILRWTDRFLFFFDLMQTVTRYVRRRVAYHLLNVRDLLQIDDSLIRDDWLLLNLRIIWLKLGRLRHCIHLICLIKRR